MNIPMSISHIFMYMAMVHMKHLKKAEGHTDRNIVSNNNKDEVNSPVTRLYHRNLDE